MDKDALQKHPVLGALFLFFCAAELAVLFVPGISLRWLQDRGLLVSMPGNSITWVRIWGYLIPVEAPLLVPLAFILWMLVVKGRQQTQGR